MLAASPPSTGAPRPVIEFVPIAISPVIVPPANANLPAKDVVIVPAKLASSPSAAANSFNVSKAAGAESITACTAVSTYVSVAYELLVR